MSDGHGEALEMLRRDDEGRVVDGRTVNEVTEEHCWRNLAHALSHAAWCCTTHCERWDDVDEALFLLGYRREEHDQSR